MEIRERVLHALKWSAGVKLAGQLLNWGITIYVIRLLSPEDYGLMAIALLFINLMLMLNELGLGAALVQKKDIDENLIRQIYGFILVGNFLFFLVLVILAPIISEFFDEPRLTIVLRVLSFQFLIMAFELVPMALLERKLNLKSKSLAQLSGQIAGGLTTLFFAITGHGVWALVYGVLVDSCVRMIAMNIAHPFIKLPRLSFAGMKECMTFGGFVTGERVMWYFYSQADIFIIGKILGKDLLGIYSVAMHLSSLIMHKTGEVIYTVSFPAFAKVQHEKNKVGEYFLKAVRVLSFVMFPIFFGIAAISQEIVYVVLGEKWVDVSPILQILCLVMPLRMISNLLPPMLQGLGKASLSFYNLLLAVTVMPIAFYIGTKWGLTGVSLAWIFAFPLVLFVMLKNSLTLVSLRVVDVIRSSFMPLIISVVMLFGIHYLRDIILHDILPFYRLLTLTIVGVLIYTFLSFTVNRRGLDEFLDLAKNRK